MMRIQAGVLPKEMTDVFSLQRGSGFLEEQRIQAVAAWIRLLQGFACSTGIQQITAARQSRVGEQGALWETAAVPVLRDARHLSPPPPWLGLSDPNHLSFIC